jgi:hypothetical protein
MPTAFGDFKLVAYEQINTNEVHMALIKGEWEKNEPVHGAGTLFLRDRRYFWLLPMRLWYAITPVL